MLTLRMRSPWRQPCRVLGPVAFTGGGPFLIHTAVLIGVGWPEMEQSQSDFKVFSLSSWKAGFAVD